MDVHQIAIPVADLDRAIAFYRDLLGDEPIASFDSPGLAFFPLGGTRLLLDRGGATGALLYLRVDDIVAKLDDLRGRGVEITHEPHLIFPDTDGMFGPPRQDEWMAFIRDSEGNLVGLAERRDQAG
jgi:methylmalonyl-CoA/ethylmalonyl-CoA epimerase